MKQPKFIIVRSADGVNYHYAYAMNHNAGKKQRRWKAGRTAMRPLYVIRIHWKGEAR